MWIALLTLAAFASARVEDAALPSTVAAVEQRAGASIAVISPNRAAENGLRELIGEYTYLRAGSPSESVTLLHENGFACGVHLSRDRSAWTLAEVGECNAVPIARSPPTAVPLVARIQQVEPAGYRNGIRMAQWGLAAEATMLPFGFLAVIQSDGTSASNTAPFAAVALAGPALVAVGSLQAAERMRGQGIPVWRGAGQVGVAMSGAVAVSFAGAVGFDSHALGGAALLLEIGSLASGWIQLAADANAFQHNFVRASRVRTAEVVPLVLDHGAGVALAGSL